VSLPNLTYDKEITALLVVDPYKDATADYSDADMNAALNINIPNYASAVVTTAEVVEALTSL
jgi:hypothetical protein